MFILSENRAKKTLQLKESAPLNPYTTLVHWVNNYHLQTTTSASHHYLLKWTKLSKFYRNNPTSSSTHRKLTTKATQSISTRGECICHLDILLSNTIEKKQTWHVAGEHHQHRAQLTNSTCCRAPPTRQLGSTAMACRNNGVGKA